MSSVFHYSFSAVNKGIINSRRFVLFSQVLLYKIFQPLYLEPSPKRVVIGIDN